VEVQRSSARRHVLTEPHAAAPARSYSAAATTSSTASTSSTSRDDISTELHRGGVSPNFSTAATGGGAQRRVWTELPGGSDDHELLAAATSSSFCAGNPRSSSAPDFASLRLRSHEAVGLSRGGQVRSTHDASTRLGCRAARWQHRPAAPCRAARTKQAADAVVPCSLELLPCCHCCSEVVRIDLAAKEVYQVCHIHSLPVVPMVIGLSACQVCSTIWCTVARQHGMSKPRSRSQLCCLYDS
jgi:hypothetical protein